MSDQHLSGYKTNYFGSFLDSMNTPSSATPDSGRQVTPPSVADALMQTLLQHDGRADVKDLLPHTGFSVDRLIQVINTLDSFGLVKRDGGNVEMTAAGRAAAAAKSAI
jgi:predicted methyltransferase